MTDRTNPYYADNTRISNSAIGWFLEKGPAYLHDKLQGKIPDEKGPQLERGTMIHEYLLQPEEFSKDYIVWNKSRPASAQQEKFCQALAETLEIEPNRAILSAYKSAYSTNGKTDGEMLSKGQEMASTLKDYIDYLKQPDKPALISQYDVKMLEDIAQNVHEHKAADMLIKNEFNKDEDMLCHEFHIDWEFPTENGSVRCKSLLDSVRFDYTSHTYTLVDLKTTAKLYHFEDSMKTYDYLRQLCFYNLAILWWLKQAGENLDNWHGQFYIVAVDAYNNTHDVRVFEFSLDQIGSRLDDIDHALTDIAWHIKNDKWKHTVKYYNGTGVEKLSL